MTYRTPGGMAESTHRARVNTERKAARREAISDCAVFIAKVAERYKPLAPLDALMPAPFTKVIEQVLRDAAREMVREMK